MEFNQIVELIKTISESKVTSFTLEEGDKKLTIKAGDNKQPQVIQVPHMVPVQATMTSAVPTVAPAIAETSLMSGMPSNTIGMSNIEAMNEGNSSMEVETALADDINLKTVMSPLVGTFYSAPSPDAEPFVRVGDTVKKGQVVGIVEAMKLMNEIESEHDGVVTEIMVNNGDMVEYGQVIIKIK